MKYLLLLPLVVVLFAGCTSWPEESSNDELLASSVVVSEQGTDRATAYTSGNRIVLTDTGTVVLAYSENDGEEPFKTYETMSAQVVEIEPESGDILSRRELGKQYDNHGTPVITHDDSGYIHAVWGPHGDGPLQYRRTMEPNDISEWTEVEQVDTEVEGFEGLTYPVLHVSNDGGVHVAGSLGSAAVYIRSKGDSWGSPQVFGEASDHFARYHVNMIPNGDELLFLVPDMNNVVNDGYTRTTLRLFRKNLPDGEIEFVENVWTPEDGDAYYNSAVVDESGTLHFTMIQRSETTRERSLYVVSWAESQERTVNRIDLSGRYVGEAKIALWGRQLVVLFQASADDENTWHSDTNRLYLAQRCLDSQDCSFTVEEIPVDVSYSEEESIWLPSVTEYVPGVSNGLPIAFTVGENGGGGDANKNVVQTRVFLSWLMR